MKKLVSPFLFNRRLTATLQAIGRSQAVIEFEIDGTVITCNDKFLEIVGYRLDEVVGRHHRLFVDPIESQTPAYALFWDNLARGQFQAKEFKRVGKGGKEVWIQASYNPVLGAGGRPVRVVKIATDVTKQKLLNADYAGQVSALSKAQGVVEFDMDGTILTANDNFLAMFGYALPEISGRHHTLFLAPEDRGSKAYADFWTVLRTGQYQTAEYKRIGKNGKEVWLQATYNPVLDLNGTPFKVIKVATDVTTQKIRSADFSGQIQAIGKSQAVIEFDLDGIILDINANFLHVLGYAKEELCGKHHSLLVEPDNRDSFAYRDFWAALNRGEFRSGEFRRIGKGGKGIWIQATYNPIFDLNGRPFKVVKFASDVTAQVVARKKSEHMTTMLQEVAAGAEQMTASVTQISEAMLRSTEAAKDAQGKAEAADRTTARLAVAAQAMGGIVALIESITGQINLLALNATIESARAGEAGRGFSIVAQEVKTLAGQAKAATDRITTEISAMRSVSSDVVSHLDAIKDSIAEVRNYVVTTTTAVQEQTIVASAISKSVQRAAREASTIN